MALSRLTSGVEQGKIGGTANAVQSAGSPALNGMGQSNTLIQFKGNEGCPEVVTVSVFAEATIAIDDVSAPGPLVGTAKFGSGNGAVQEVEFDICLNRGQPVIGGQVVFGGVIFSVPCSSCEVWARNDANVIPGQGTLPVELGSNKNAAKVTASLAVGTRAGSNVVVTRTVYAVVSGIGGGLPNGAAPGSIALIPVPAFAKRFRIIRQDAGQTIQISILANVTPQDTDGPYNVAANDPGPSLSLPGGATFVQVQNTGAAAIRVVGAVFELGI